MSKVVNRVPTILHDLKTGFGAQRLPASLVAIEVRGVTTSRTVAPHRIFLKSILPRIKYNNPALKVEVLRVTTGRQAKKNAQGSVTKEETEEVEELEKVETAQVTTDGAPKRRHPIASARLRFKDGPMHVVKFAGHKTADDIARSVFERIAKVTGEGYQVGLADRADTQQRRDKKSTKISTGRQLQREEGTREETVAAITTDNPSTSAEAESASPVDEPSTEEGSEASPHVPSAKA